jgi:hypothetical protein
MELDSVIAEIQQIKRHIAAQYGNDVRKLGRAVQEEQRREGRTVVSLQRKPTTGKPGRLS